MGQKTKFSATGSLATQLLWPGLGHDWRLKPETRNFVQVLSREAVAQRPESLLLPLRLSVFRRKLEQRTRNRDLTSSTAGLQHPNWQLSFRARDLLHIFNFIAKVYGKGELNGKAISMQKKMHSLFILHIFHELFEDPMYFQTYYKSKLAIVLY